MLILRCTAKLLVRVGSAQQPTSSSTTALGDWYAAPLALGRKRYVLAISERSRLPVLLAGRDLKHLAENFPGALAAVLRGLGISFAAIEAELAAARPVVISTTNSRSHLGTLNDFSAMLKWMYTGGEEIDLVGEALRLSHTPVGPLRPEPFPDKVTRRLLEG